MLRHRVYIIPIVVVIYMLSALTWWAILLYKENEMLYELQKEKIKNSISSPDITYGISISLGDLEKEYGRRRWMIIGEATVFGLAMVAGIWLIYAAFRRELRLGRRQTNFLLSVTHEFRSPLASIKLFLGTLMQRKLQEDKVKLLAGSNFEEAERLESLVNNILLAAHLESGYSFNFEVLDAALMVQKITNSFALKYPGIEFSVEGNHKLHFSGDYETMYVVFRNLIENAAKYTLNGQKVDIIYRRTPSNELIFEVKDQGPGVQIHERDLIFEKFYRSGLEENRKTSGTGLGLYLVKYIIDAHHGKINVSGNQPQGSIFRISIPKKVNK